MAVATVDDTIRRERVDEVRSIAPSPIPVSAREGVRLAGLIEEVIGRLPTERATLTIPNCGAAMGLVSWAYDWTAVGSVSYAGTEVTIELCGRPELVEQAIAKAEEVRNG